MARLTAQQIVDLILSKHEPLIREAFLRAIDDIRSSVTLRVIVEALERGDVEGAVRALQIEPEAFAGLERAIADASADAGQAEVDNLPQVRGADGNRVVWRFGVRNIAAETWLRQHSSTLVTYTTEDMKQSIREVLSEGLAQGQNPTRTGMDIIGRVNRATNRREGGILGLTAPQARAVANARRKLTSGDPAAMREVIGMRADGSFDPKAGLGKRGRRFDRTIAKAIREGKPLPDEFVTRWLGKYSDNLLKLRGDLIGLNETFAAMARGRADAIRQQIDAGKIDVQDVTKVWKHTPQEHPRLHHQAMNGKSVAYGEKFVLPNGVRMDYPHSEDAPISETAFCKCTFAFKIDFFGSVERRFRAEAV